MNNNIKFLQSFKGKTVDEVIAILQKEEQEINDKQSLLQKQKIEWYRRCIGKYYLINFNNTSFIVVHIKERVLKGKTSYDVFDPRYFLTWECYNIILSDQPKIEAKELFNILWLRNPYDIKVVSTIACKEITKEEFERIISPFNSLINEIKQVLNEIHSIQR